MESHLRINQIAALLGCSPLTIRRRLVTCKIAIVRSGRLVLVPQSELHKLIHREASIPHKKVAAGK